MSDDDAADHPAAPGLSGAVALILVGATAVLSALLEALFVPLYAGSTLVPVAVLLALAGNIVLPLLARSAWPATPAVASPFVLWLLVMVGFGIYTRPEGDVILPGGGPEWVSYGVLLGGALAGVITVVSAAPRRR